MADIDKAQRSVSLLFLLRFLLFVLFAFTGAFFSVAIGAIHVNNPYW